MKKFCGLILSKAIFLISCSVYLLGMFFAVSFYAAIVSLLHSSPALVYVAVTWKYYLWLVVFNFWFFLTLCYLSQNFFVLPGLLQHMRYQGWKSLCGDFLRSFLWPFYWLVIDTVLRKKNSNLVGGLTQVFRFWLFECWHGRLVIVYLSPGTIKKYRIKTLQDYYAVLSEIEKHFKAED